MQGVKFIYSFIKGGLMNRKSFIILLVSLLYANVCAAENVFAPQWSEFCPKEYLNAKSRGGWTFFKPDTYDNYWHERKLQFEDNVSKCTAYSGNDLAACYQQVREAELIKNAAWNAKLEKED